MATTTRVLDANVNGTVYTSNANAALEALDTCHSGATAPTDEVANGKLWLDTSTTPGILKIYNNATWEVVHSGTADINGGTIDGTVIGGTTPAAVTGTTGIFTFVEINNEIELIGASGGNALIQKNASVGRDELQIYSGGDAYQIGSRGAGIHLYGNSDNEHAGNLTVLTGPDDQGDGRLIVSGREAKTHVTIGNGIFDYVDLANDHALLNLKGAVDQPALLIEGAGATEGDIVTVTGENLQFGHWDKATTTFTQRMEIKSDGNVGIGCSPSYNLDLQSSGDTTLNVKSTGTGDADAIVVIDAADLGESVVEFRHNGVPKASIEWFNANSDLNIATELGTDGSIDFQPNGSLAMRIDKDGNVGVGVASPSAPLDIRRTGTTTLQVKAVSSGAGNDDDATLILDAAETGEANLLLKQSGVTKAFIHWWNPTSNLEIATSPGSDGNIDFRPNGSLAMRVSSSNKVGIGTSSPNSTLDVISATTCMELDRTGSNGFVAAFQRSGTTVGNISVTASSTAYNTSSDYRLKENITSIQGASDIVKAMQPVTYTFKSDGSWHDGFLAHELQELHPRAVIGEKDAMVDEEYEVTPAVEATYDAEGVELTPAVPAVMGTRSVPDYQGVDYSKLTPILTAALQEALNKIDALEARVAALEP